MKNQVRDAQWSAADSFQPLLKDQELLAKIIESFPYPIQIFSADGTADDKQGVAGHDRHQER